MYVEIIANAQFFVFSVFDSYSYCMCCQKQDTITRRRAEKVLGDLDGYVSQQKHL